MTLNGLRGVAAVCVMTYHRPEWFRPNFWFTDAYLAVDFFFMLSGFVLARAYIGKIGKSLRFGAFMSRRFQRLYPLTFLGGALGALVFFADHHGRVGRSLWIEMAATMLTLPTPWGPVSWRLDPPMWSLFYEITVNVIFGLIASFLLGRRLWIFVIAAGVLFTAFYPIEYFGYTTPLGEFLSDIIRVAFLFFFGVLLERMNERGILSRLRIGMGVGGALLVASFAIHDGGPLASAARFAAITLLYPLIIMGGANHEPRRILRRVAAFSGDISYPVYLLHFPLLAMIAGAGLMIQIPKEPRSLPEIVGRFALVILLSWIALKLYDEPARRILSLWSSRKSAVQSPKIGAREINA